MNDFTIGQRYQPTLEGVFLLEVEPDGKLIQVALMAFPPQKAGEEPDGDFHLTLTCIAPVADAYQDPDDGLGTVVAFFEGDDGKKYALEDDQTKYLEPVNV